MARLLPAMILLVCAAPVLAQALQDSTLDNLVHVPGYRTAEPGTLGAVVERGKGPVDLVLVSGFGLGASVFDEFMRRNAKHYHMLAVTLPGFENTAAPPMPPTGTSYGDQTWSKPAAEAVAELIRKRKLKHPVLVGHFINGTQVVARVAAEYPELARAVILLAGTALYEPTHASRFWPQRLTVEKRTEMIDRYMAPRWFKTVTRRTWVAGNFVATDYSPDSSRGRPFADLANQPPLPVLIRYLCEFHASDVRPDLTRMTQPLLVIQPNFTAALRADTTRSYLQGYFQQGWKETLDNRPSTERINLDDAGILVMNDRASEVDAAIAAFVKRYVK